MNKFKSAVFFECSTKIKPMAIFYSVEFIFIAVILTLLYFLPQINGQFSGFEVGSMFFLAVVSISGLVVDFKTLIQNGFTRKYIYFATICMFLFFSATMAFIDTIISRLLPLMNNRYYGLVHGLYGHGHFLSNWLWCTVVYFLLCSLCYLVTIIIYKIGAVKTLLIGGGLYCTILVITILTQTVFSQETLTRLKTFLLKCMGFMGDGSNNLIFPILTFLFLGVVTGLGAYAILRRTEVK